MSNSWPENQWETHAIKCHKPTSWGWFIQSIYGLGWCTLGFTTLNDPSSWLAQKCRSSEGCTLVIRHIAANLGHGLRRGFSRAWEPCFDGNKNGGANVGKSWWIWWILYLKPICLNLALMTILRCHHWGIQCGNIYANGSGVLAQDLLLLSCEDLPVQSLVQEPLRGCSWL